MGESTNWEISSRGAIDTHEAWKPTGCSGLSRLFS
jgi:hypothetical protein